MQRSPDYSIDCNFPGGNIILDRIEGENVYLHQELRDTTEDWFYWYFRVSGAAGRNLTFHFTGSNVIGVLGPGVSRDGGHNWFWLGAQAVEDTSFHYQFAPNETEVRFSIGMPYLEENLRHFLSQYRSHPNLSIETLCKTQKGREAELLRLGRLNGSGRYAVILTCRHHCCEMMASYSLEGILETVLGNSADGNWFRENTEFLVIPFVDKDGVEDGDQGKLRRPHDHNRDYGESSLYPTVRAIREFIPRWLNGRPRFTMDMHCPWIRGDFNEFIYYVGNDNQLNWQTLSRFSGILESVQTGPLVFQEKNNLPWGKEWNTAANYVGGGQFDKWVQSIPGEDLLTCGIEIPYANASGAAVTAETARAFGHNLAKAIRRFLEEYRK